MPAGERPAFEVMDTASATFAHYLKVRANRRDDFYRVPAGGVDLCNVQVPVRKKT
jgi:peptidylprolyl isomerase